MAAARNSANRAQRRPTVLGASAGDGYPISRGMGIMTWARTLFYAHCAVTVACVASVAYGFSRYDMAWQFRLYVERLLSYPGGWPAYYLLKLSCLALGVVCTVPGRSSAW